MIIIREVFICKPGQASKLAKVMKEMMSGPNVRVLTDLTGVFNKVVVETEMENLAAFEKRMEDYKNMPSQDRNKMAGYTDMYSQGKREIYRVW